MGWRLVKIFQTVPGYYPVASKSCHKNAGPEIGPLVPAFGIDCEELVRLSESPDEPVQNITT